MIIIDFHSHILPGLDHGSTSVDTSLSQLSLARDAGVSGIVATSHFYPHMHNARDFAEKREKAYKELMSAYKAETPRLFIGAEVLICEGINRMPDLELLCIEGTRCLLLELPLGIDRAEPYVDTVESLISDGYQIILAHADRYPSVVIDRFVKLGAKIQLNASSLSGVVVKRHVKNWIQKEKVVALGSDIHGADTRSYKKFTKAIAKLDGRAESIMQASYSILYQSNQ